MINVNDKELSFSGYGLGARGLNQYKFHIDLFSAIEQTASSYKIIDSKVDFTLQKQKVAWWPRVTTQPQKPHWLRVDFDRWHSEEDNEEPEPRNVMTDYPGMYDKLQMEEYGYRKGKKTSHSIFNFI